jgi:hypothetical protein
VRTYLPLVGRAHHAECTCNSPLARPTGFYQRVGAPRSQGSSPSFCPSPMPQGVPYVQISGLGACIRNLIPIRTRLPRLRSWGVWVGAMLALGMGARDPFR